MFDFGERSAAQALATIRQLQDHGFTAYLAGGCVRDAMLGRSPKDFDVATDATPDTVRGVFGRRKTLAFGASFGVIGVLGEGAAPTEVATFRSDGDYSDGRRPDSVRFGNAEQDALRRDFTINGMFYDPVADEVIDYVGGQTDLANRVIRAIGDPVQRFAEDKLRMLRAVRFAASLGFQMESNTAAAIRQYASGVTIVSGERIGAELRRMFGGFNAADALGLLRACELLEFIWPIFDRCCRDDEAIFVNAIELAKASQPPSFVALVAAIIARMITTAADVDILVAEVNDLWRLSGDEVRSIGQSVCHRDEIIHADKLPWSSVQPILVSRDAEAIVDTAAAWTIAFEKSRYGVEFCRNRLDWPREKLDPTPLITGDVLRQHGYQPGPQFRVVLDAIRRQQLDGELTSQVDALDVAARMLA